MKILKRFLNKRFSGFNNGKQKNIMTESKSFFDLIFLSCYPSVIEILYSEKELNIISANRIKNNFLKRDNDIIIDDFFSKQAKI